MKKSQPRKKVTTKASHSTREPEKVASKIQVPGISQRRKHLDQRLQVLLQRTIAIEEELKSIEDPRFFRACIFGSARIQQGNKTYNDVATLAELLASQHIDILTGGGPGLMEAANMGAQRGRQEKLVKSKSFGMTVQLDFEPLPNSHLDIKRHHHRFSSRLDDFMRLSHAVIVTPGGIGTLLELFFTWQLIQVRHITPRPLILLDKKFWKGLMEWIESEVLSRKLISDSDILSVALVDTPQEACELVVRHRNSLLSLP